MMKRHLTRAQDDIDRSIHVHDVTHCVAPAQDVCLLWFFEVREGPGVSSGQHTQTAVIDCAVCERDPGGNQARL